MSSLDGIFAQANSTIDTIAAEGKSVYENELAQAQAATVKGDELTQQAKVSNEAANAEAAKASSVADVMSTTGSSGNLYQKNLVTQNETFGYDENTLEQTRQIQQQTAGQEKEALNQLQNVQGGTRGLSATGVQNRARSVQSQAISLENNLGASIQRQENLASAAQSSADTEAKAQYQSEENAQTAYSNSSLQYSNMSRSYTAAAQAEYNAATAYQKNAAHTLYSFSMAILNVMNYATTATSAFLDSQMTNLYNTLGELHKADTAYAQSQTTFVNQQITYNSQVMQDQIKAQQEANESYSMFKSAGVSNGMLKQLFG